MANVVSQFLSEMEPDRTARSPAAFERATLFASRDGGGRGGAPGRHSADDNGASDAEKRRAEAGARARIGDGFASRNDGVLILGATNTPWAVDPAFRRPGRFDRVLFVPPPDKPARRAILDIHLRGRPQEGVEVGVLVDKTSGGSGADLDNLVETAADVAIAESVDHSREVPIQQRHLVAALGELRPITSEWLATARNYARYANESGQYDEVLTFLEQHGKSWGWFVLSAFTLGSSTRWKEVGYVHGGFVGTVVVLLFVGAMAAVLGEDSPALP